MREVGFEMKLAFSTTHTESSVRADLAEIVKKKDVAGNDWLLISAGAPGENGDMYTAEELVASLALLSTPALSCENLSRVFLHRWWEGDAWQLYPDFVCIASPLAR